MQGGNKMTRDEEQKPKETRTLMEIIRQNHEALKKQTSEKK